MNGGIIKERYWNGTGRGKAKYTFFNIIVY